MTGRRMALVAAGGVVLTVALASPAAAHGAGALSGLPLPRWQYAWGAGAVVVLAFLVAGSTWRRPRLAQAAEGRPLPRSAVVAGRGAAVALRLAGVVLYVVIVTAGLFGSEFPAANIAPLAVFTTFWVGVAVASMVVGDVWRWLSPFETLALVAAWAWAGLRRRPRSPAEVPAGATHWPAVAAVAGFVWLELAYHSPSTPRILGTLGLVYGVVVLAVAARRGRGWLRTGEGFAALFSLFAALAPLDRRRVRPPLCGVARVPVRDGTMALLFVVVGATAFDGLFRTDFWAELTLERVGWGYTLVNTLGLAWAIGIVALLHLATTRLVAHGVGADPDGTARRFAPVLIPIAAAFTVAHHFSVLVLDGQGFWFLLSDPYGEGWDLLGTAGGTVDFTLVSDTTIAWVQAAAIALGHVAAVLVARDRAMADLAPRAALRAQYVLLVLVTGSAVGAVALLLGA